MPSAARSDLLFLPVGRVARALAAEQLRAAAGACRRLEKGADEQALHDFRVALRRLRSVLRAYQPWLGDIPRRLRRRLRRLARATNGARDAEVGLGALEQLFVRARGPGRSARDWLRGRFIAERDRHYLDVRQKVPVEFRRLAGELAPLLRARGARSRVGVPSPAFAVTAARLVMESAAELHAALEAVRGPGDADAVHAARIRGKRLRYLLEPLAGHWPQAGSLVRAIKRFQDESGLLCDRYVQARELLPAAEIAATLEARARLLPVLAAPGSEAESRQTEETRGQELLTGLQQLARRLDADLAARYQRFAVDHLGRRSGRLAESAARVAAALQRQVRG